MKVPLRGLAHVKLKTILYTLKNWRRTFSLSEKIAFVLIFVLIALTSWRWTQAAGEMTSRVPKSGGTFVEGVVTDSLDSIDLGRLTKASLVRVDKDNKIVPDLATKWEESEDKLSYKFNLVPSTSSYEVLDVFNNNPTYLPNTAVEVTEPDVVTLKLDEPNANFLEELSRPIFPKGPYEVDKKNENEIKLSKNKDYHLDESYIEKFIIRKYKDQQALQNAVNRGKVTGALNVSEVPENWQTKTIELAKKHVLFINSSKSYLKKTSTRERLLNGEKPEGIESLEILEVNGISKDQEYEEYKNKLRDAGIEVTVREVAAKDAVLEDLPKREYDMLYILVDKSPLDDPYSFFHSTQRTAQGQNFCEVANADIDESSEEYCEANSDDERNKIREHLSSLVDSEKVVKEFENIKLKYAVSPKVKGFSICSRCFADFDRFDLASKWYFFSKRQK